MRFRMRSAFRASSRRGQQVNDAWHGHQSAWRIQRHKDEPLEDATAKWDAPFEEVARISIPKQDFDTDAESTACENLSFSPWHALAEHRPLGSLNRGRKVVYQILSKFRHDENGAPLREP